MKRIISVVLLACLLFSTLALTSCGQLESTNLKREDIVIPEPGTSEYDLYSDVYETVAENSKIKLEYNYLTTDIQVTDKRTGNVWSTVQYDAEYDQYVRGDILKLWYYNNSGNTRDLSTGFDSVEKGQFLATEIENGIKVQYGIGDVNFKINFAIALSPERYDELLQRFGEIGEPIYQYGDVLYTDSQIQFMTSYKLIDFQDGTFANLEAEDLQAKKDSFPLAVDQPWYYMDASLSNKNIEKLNTLFAQIGYSDDEYDKDNAQVDVSTVRRPEFNVSVYYTITDEGSLDVTVPVSEIYYHEDYQLESIEFLNYMLDYDNTYDGYFLLPDGSGSIMNFNEASENDREDDVYIQIYGVDESRNIEDKSAFYNDAILPVYGACITGRTETVVDEETGEESVKKVTYDESEYQGAFVIIEEGDTFAGITARSGVSDVHNNAFLEFRLNEYERMGSFSKNVSNNESHKKFQWQMYQGDIKFSYHFLSGKDATYSGMANYYSDYLFGDEETQLKDYYSTVEFVNMVSGFGYFFGIEYNTTEVVTDFGQVLSITKELKENGFTNMNAKISGWCNGGYQHGWVDNIKISSKLGGDKAFSDLIAQMEELGVGLYPDVDIQYVYTSSDSVSRSDNASMINGSRSIVYSYDPTDFSSTLYRSKYVLTSDAMKENLDGFIEDYSEYGLKNVSFRSLGSAINANFRDKDFMDRQETLTNLSAMIAEIDDEYNIMGKGGFAPLLKYLDVVNDMPVTSSGFDKCSYSVPFTAMVLSGHIDYTADIVNLGNGEQDDLLKMIESGAGAYFMFTGTYYDKMSETTSEWMYSTVYNDPEFGGIKDIYLEKYAYLKEALTGVYGLSIVDHERLDEDVYKSTYENGVSIYVNYSNNDYTTKDGIAVKANSYTKTGKEA